MATQVAYAVLANLQYVDKDKLPLANGKAYFYDSTTGNPKEVYADSAGTIPLGTLVDLDSAGRLPPLYFAVDAPYRIILKDSADTTIWTMENFTPSGDGSAPVTVNDDIDNLFINGQFRFVDLTYSNGVPKNQNLNFAQPNWYFYEDGTNATDSLTTELFTPDATEPTATPIQYIKYTSTTNGSGETQKDLFYRIQDVRSLAGETATLQFAGISLSGGSKSVEVIIIQHFGTGGSPDVTTTFGTQTITSSWSTITVTITPPVLTGKSISAAQDDYLDIRIRLPLQQQSELGLTNFYLRRNKDPIVYPYQTYDQVRSELQALTIPALSRDDSYSLLSPRYSSYNGAPTYHWLRQTGVIQMWPTTSAPAWAHLCNGDSYVRRGFDKALYGVIGYEFTNKSGFLSTTVSTNEIDLECDIPGVCTAPSHSGQFNVTVTTIGTTTVRQVVKITVLASPTGINNYVTIHSPTVSYRIALIVGDDYEGDLPVATGIVLIPVQVSTSATVTQIRDAIQTVLSTIENTGTLSADNLTTSVTGSDIDVTSVLVGAAKSSPSTGTSGFSVTVTTPGTATTREVTQWTTVAGSSLSGGEYFDQSTPNADIRFWFIVNGNGQQPAGSPDYFVPVEIVGNETANDLATLVAGVMDYVFFKVPDMRGLFVRGKGRSTITDILHYDGTRMATPSGSGTNPGTLQYNMLKQHLHANTNAPYSDDNYGGGGTAAFNEYENRNVEPTGGRESRPNNIDLNFIIYW